MSAYLFKIFSLGRIIVMAGDHHQLAPVFNTKLESEYENIFETFCTRFINDPS